jgi:hypothetical protein
MQFLAPITAKLSPKAAIVIAAGSILLSRRVGEVVVAAVISLCCFPSPAAMSQEHLVLNKGPGTQWTESWPGPEIYWPDPLKRDQSMC